jgi:hypothetical protein
MKPTTERFVDAYLKQLDSELADLPRLRRKEIVEEISEHIAEARAASPSQGEAEIRTLLDRLGDPAEIASEAKERFGVQPRKSRALEIATLLLLLVGGVVLPVIGWLIGVVLLWVSDAWDSRDKLIGTLVVPGGLLLPLALLTIGTSAGGGCSTPVPAAGAREAAACTAPLGDYWAASTDLIFSTTAPSASLPPSAASATDCATSSTKLL